MDRIKIGSQTLFFRLSLFDKFFGWKIRILLAVFLLVGSVVFSIKGFPLRSSGDLFNQYLTLALLMLWGCISQIPIAIKQYSDSKHNPN